jgi:hypothetical protein
MYSNQTGRFLQVCSFRNKYIMAIQDIDSNSLRADSLNNNTGGKLILGCALALECMQKAGIVPKHQVLDNQASVAYKMAISNSDLTYELVSSNDY